MFSNKLSHLASLMRNEKKSIDELIYSQQTKLKSLLSHAYRNVPLYRKKFQDSGFEPGDVKSIDDIHKIPITSKDDFHAHDIRDCIDQHVRSFKALIPIKTSGSSGQALQFFIDQEYDQFRKAQCLRPYLTNGQRPFDRTITFTGHPRNRKKLHEYLFLFRDRQISAHLSSDVHVEYLEQMQPEVVRGYPSVLALLGTTILNSHVSIKPPRCVFTDSELLTSSERNTIETAFSQQVIDIYGTLETDNIAYECEMHSGYHIAMDCVIMEFVRDGRTVEPGRHGEIICTVLNNYAMPFIRYKINDTALYSADECSCGRTFPLMKSFQGRVHDFAVTKTGQYISSTSILAKLDEFAPFVKAYQIIQCDVDSFQLRLIPGNQFFSSFKNQIESRMKKLFPDAEMDIICCDQLLQESSGKVMPFKSLVHNKEQIFQE